MLPSAFADYCAGLPDAVGERGGPLPSSGNTSAPAASSSSQPASPAVDPVGTLPSAFADYCAGLPDAVGERGGP
jgi:hypothetical protein